MSSVLFFIVYADNSFTVNACGKNSMIFLATMQPVKTLPEPFSGMGVNIDKALKEVD
jgi:hypothetical protein